jgi:toxin-antitoxin system PIN domain toxin
VLIDANILLYAVDQESPFHERSASWLTAQLNGPRRVALPWPTLVAFLRISTNARAFREPLAASTAWAHVHAWLDTEPAWVPVPTERHGDVFESLITRYHLTAGRISDAHVAALAIEHGLTVCSADTDFARFTELQWLNPLAA